MVAIPRVGTVRFRHCARAGVSLEVGGLPTEVAHPERPFRRRTSEPGEQAARGSAAY
jgi:hypothetical protein